MGDIGRLRGGLIYTSEITFSGLAPTVITSSSDRAESASSFSLHASRMVQDI